MAKKPTYTDSFAKDWSNNTYTGQAVKGVLNTFFAKKKAPPVKPVMGKKKMGH